MSAHCDTGTLYKKAYYVLYAEDNVPVHSPRPNLIEFRLSGFSRSLSNAQGEWERISRNIRRGFGLRHDKVPDANATLSNVTTIVDEITLFQLVISNRYHVCLSCTRTHVRYIKECACRLPMSVPLRTSRKCNGTRAVRLTSFFFTTL
jgi:hypothetical protein